MSLEKTTPREVIPEGSRNFRDRLAVLLLATALATTLASQPAEAGERVIPTEGGFRQMSIQGAAQAQEGQVQVREGQAQVRDGELALNERQQRCLSDFDQLNAQFGARYPKSVLANALEEKTPSYQGFCREIISAHR